MENAIHEKKREIKKNLRLSMNGVVSAHQRRQGLNYKINFGVEIPRIKEIASAYEKDKMLAQSLWQENIRECKLLAIFLYPIEDFDTETAEKWIAECEFTETADHLSRVLLASLPEAVKVSLQWVASGSEMFEYCGYSALSNLFMKKTVLGDDDERMYYAALKNTLYTSATSSRPTQNAASISLMKFAELGELQKIRACSEVSSWGVEKNTSLGCLVENILEKVD